MIKQTRYASTFLSIALLATLPYIASAQAENKAKQSNNNIKLQGIVTGGFTFGGDEISRERIDRKFGGSDTETIDAGEFIYFAGGVAVTQNNFQVQATIGYHADLINGDNGDTGFCRYPLELIAFYKTDKFRVGAGLSHHLNPEYERDVDGAPKINVAFDNATGFVMQAEYIFQEQIGIGLRYMDIEYEAEFSSSSKIDGSHIGIIGTWMF